MADPGGLNVALPVGYELLEYRIESVLGVGGFGVTYKALDVQLNRHVAIKEYLPVSLADRFEAKSVAPRSERDVEEYEWGKRRFLDEARTLAQFQHPNIVSIVRFFEANGTAYIVMVYEEGQDFEQILLSIDGQPDETLLVDKLLMPLLDGLELVHGKGVLHRDIKPSNIYIRTDDTPVLIDFGSARQELGGKSQNLTSIVSKGYSPLEQYSGTSRQGPWTDIYSLCGTLYRAATGVRPVDAAERFDEDMLEPASDLAKGSYSASFLSAIDQGLRMQSRERPQSVADLRELLAGRSPSRPASTQQPAMGETVRLSEEELRQAGAEFDAAAPEPPKQEPRKRKIGVFVGGTAGALAMAAVFAMVLWPEGEKDARPTTTASVTGNTAKPAADKKPSSTSRPYLPSIPSDGPLRPTVAPKTPANTTARRPPTSPPAPPSSEPARRPTTSSQPPSSTASRRPTTSNQPPTSSNQPQSRPPTTVVRRPTQERPPSSNRPPATPSTQNPSSGGPTQTPTHPTRGPSVDLRDEDAILVGMNVPQAFREARSNHISGTLIAYIRLRQRLDDCIRQNCKNFTAIRQAVSQAKTANWRNGVIKILNSTKTNDRSCPWRIVVDELVRSGGKKHRQQRAYCTRNGLNRVVNDADRIRT